MPHPPFLFDEQEEALKVAREAFESGFLEREEPDMLKEGEQNALIFQLGPGCSIQVASEKRLDELVAKQRYEEERIQRMAQNLVSAPPEEEGPYVLLITVPGRQVPFWYQSREDALKSVREGLKRGFLEHKATDEDTVFFQMGPGTIYMVLSNEHYEMQKRKAIEGAIAQAQAQRAAQQQGGPRLVVPGKN